jgi:chromosome partitioning protein
VEMPPGKPAIYDCMVNRLDPFSAIVATKTPNLDMIPSNVDLVGAEIELVDHMKREFVLRSVVDKIKDRYDFVFIDCLPSLGLITVNALAAADSVIIPVQCEIFALEGLSKLKNTISLVQRQLNPKLKIEGILLSMYDRRLRLANMVLNEIKEHSKEKVFDTIIHRNSKIGEAPGLHQPVILYDSGSKGATNFLNLADEFIKMNNVSRRSGAIA